MQAGLSQLRTPKFQEKTKDIWSTTVPYEAVRDTATYLEASDVPTRSSSSEAR